MQTADKHFEKHRNFNCYDSVIVNVGKMFERNVSLFFLNAFEFMYNRAIDGKITLGSIIWNSYDNYLYPLRHFCGINANDIDVHNVTDIQNLIKNCVESNMYISIRVDSSDLPWSINTYVNRLHNILVIDYADNGFSVADSYLLDSLEEVPHDFFEKINVKSITAFSSDNGFKLEHENVGSYLKQLAEHFLEMGIPSLKDFRSDILTLDMDREDTALRIENAYLIFGLSNICWSRQNFKDALIYYFQEFNVYETNILLDGMDISLRLWLKIKHLLLRYCLTRSHRLLTEVSDCIKSVIAAESEIAFQLITQFA